MQIIYALEMQFLFEKINLGFFQIFCGTIFAVEIYWMTGQPLELERFVMFLSICLLITFVSQSFGLMIGSAFDVIVSLKKNTEDCVLI